MKGRLTSVSMEVDSSILAFSAASFRRCRAILSLRRSMPWSLQELVGQKLHDPLVEIVAAQVGVAVGGLHLEDAFADLQDGDVEGAAAQVEDRDALVFLLVQAVGQRRAVGSLMMRSTFKPGDPAGVLGGLALGVVEVGRHGDDRLVDLFPQVLLRGLLHLGEDHGGNFGGAVQTGP